MNREEEPVAALISTTEAAPSWAAAFRELDLPLPFEVWPEISDPNRVAYAIVARPPAGLLASFPNLRATLSLWAGVDHVTKDPDWPSHVPLIRMIEDGMTAGMREFVLAQVLSAHLQLPDFANLQRERIWRTNIRGQIGCEPLVSNRTVGVLGLGVLGTVCAEVLVSTGFNVTGWSRSAKTIPGVTCHNGAFGLTPVLEASDILVNLLPATPETYGVLNAENLGKLPKGAWIINVARGDHVVDGDLLTALDSGHLGGAILDAFEVEPLDPEHPFWGHPKVVVTPHVASTTRVATGAPRIVEVMRALEAGDTVNGVYDPVRGY